MNLQHTHTIVLHVRLSDVTQQVRCRFEILNNLVLDIFTTKQALLQTN
jgi:hypothetical protein